MITTPFWYTDISILYGKDSIMEIFPSRRFDILRKLNAIVRLSIVYTLIMYFMKREQKYLIIPLVTMGITWIIWYKQEDIHTDTVLKDSIPYRLSTSMDPYLHTFPISLRMRSTIIRCSARSFSLKYSSPARRSSLMISLERGLVPFMGKDAMLPLED